VIGGARRVPRGRDGLSAFSTFFLTLTGAISIEGTFWLFAGFGVAALVFFVVRLPETKNRSLEEISDEATDEAVGT
jgi:major inositol transporter-like SP family MFS transporter